MVEQATFVVARIETNGERCVYDKKQLCKDFRYNPA